MNGSVVAGAFAAASIEVIEMVAIVVAVGVSRSWRATLLGAAGGLVMLVVLVATLGAALRGVPLGMLRLVVGALLLVFGLQWLRKGILRVSRDGWAVGQGEENVDPLDVAPSGLDWTAVVLAFKGVSLEGLEVAVIVVAFGAAAGAIGSAVVGATAAVLVVGVVGIISYRWVARIPRRALQLFVGVMLTTFGTFWSGEGLGVAWAGEDWALLWLAGAYIGGAFFLLRLVRHWRTPIAVAGAGLPIVGAAAAPVGTRESSGLVRSVVLFWVDFVLGDDWTVAAAVGLGLLGTWGLIELGLAAGWLVPAVVGSATAASLYRAARRERPYPAGDGG